MFVTRSLVCRRRTGSRHRPYHLDPRPGLGFDKTGADGWRILRAARELSELGYPVLMGASRKRMIGEVIADLPEWRLADPARGAMNATATAVVSAFAAQAGAWGVRVHDVAGTVRRSRCSRLEGAEVTRPHTRPGARRQDHADRARGVRTSRSLRL